MRVMRFADLFPHLQFTPFTPFGVDALFPEGAGDGGSGSGGGSGGDSQGGAGSGSEGSGSDGGEAGAAGSGGAGSGDGNEGASKDGGQGDPKTVTMSQAELDELIAGRMAKAKKSWEAEAKTAADRAKMDEAERLKAEKSDAEKAAKSATEQANARIVRSDARIAAVDAKVRPERAAAFVKLLDLSEVGVDDDGNADAKALKKAIDAGLKEYPEFKVSDDGKSAGRSGADNMNGNGGKQRATSLEDAVAAKLGG